MSALVHPDHSRTALGSSLNRDWRHVSRFEDLQLEF